MITFIDSVSSLSFELENVMKRFDGKLSKEEYMKSIDMLRYINYYLQNKKVDEFLKTLNIKRYAKEREDIDKKNYKNIIKNKDEIKKLIEPLKERVKIDEPYTEHKIIRTDEMISNIKYFLRTTDKESYDLFLKMLDYEDLYETDKNVQKGIYDNNSKRAFIVFKNTHDINTELNIIYMVGNLLGEFKKKENYLDYEYLNNFKEYKGLYNELLFLESLNPSSRSFDTIRIYKKMLMKVRNSAVNVSKLLDTKNFKLAKDNISAINDFRYLMSFMLSVESLDNDKKKIIKRFIEDNNLFNSKVFDEINVNKEDVAEDFKKSYTKHINK